VSRRMKALVAATAVVGSQGALVAWAATNSTSASDGGNTVKVGASSATSEPGRGVHHGGGKSGSTGPSCTYTPLPAQNAATFGPGGSTPGSWYFVKCSGKTLTIYNGALSWIPSTPPTQDELAVTPNALALKAADSLSLPPPVIDLNPSLFSVVNLSTWLWIDPQNWHSFRATATAGGVSATAVAAPQSVSWSMGDGNTVVCDGPGTPFLPTISSDLQKTNCSYTYRASSAGQRSSDGESNDGAFRVSATITWVVNWSATGAAGGGALTPLHTTSTVSVRVEQIESVGTAG